MRASPELSGRLHALYAAMTDGDAERVESLYSLAPGSLFIGTSGEEFWTDSARHNADVRPYWTPGNLTVTAGHVHAISIGDVGFTVDRPTMRLRDGTTFDLRLTLIWRREADGWRVIHSHASVAS